MNFEEFVNQNEMTISSGEALNHNVLVFAFVGDAVFTLYIREFLASTSTKKAGVLHTETSKFVKAGYQSKLLDFLLPLLNENESRICNTARNVKTHNVAKNSNLEEYKKATSFESLLGYLYMTKQNQRLMEILEICKTQIQGDR